MLLMSFRGQKKKSDSLPTLCCLRPQ